MEMPNFSAGDFGTTFAEKGENFHKRQMAGTEGKAKWRVRPRGHPGGGGQVDRQAGGLAGRRLGKQVTFHVLV